MSHAGKAVLLTASLVTALASIDAVWAQGRGGGPGGGGGPGQTQGRAQGQGQGQNPGQAQGGAGPSQPGRAAQPGQARGGVAQTRRTEIRDTLRSRDIYGSDLMSAEERREYRDRVNAALSDREWARIREQHINEMRARAQAQGRPLDPPIYGEHMLTRQERNEYRERITAAETAAERERVQLEHREMIRERALLLGLDPPPFD